VADGNLHPQILGTRKEDVEKIKREIYDKTRSLGGAIRGNME
jgi:FAD/FMN-containing dehydrogenase